VPPAPLARGRGYCRRYRSEGFPFVRLTACAREVRCRGVRGRTGYLYAPLSVVVWIRYGCCRASYLLTQSAVTL
jgi:hypothetical protein